MDTESRKRHLIACIKKYKYVLFAVLAGILLMSMPETNKKVQEDNINCEIVQEDLEKDLSMILSKIQGVGKTDVLLTEASGKNTIYQTDAGLNHSNLDTVIVTDRNREEVGLIKQVLSPVYKGAIVVCQGADSASVKLSVVEAVKSVTGLSADCITVLKMK